MKGLRDLGSEAVPSAVVVSASSLDLFTTSAVLVVIITGVFTVVASMSLEKPNEI